MTRFSTVSGVEAIARLLLLRFQLDEQQGLTTGTMVSGYPGSPLGGLDFAIEGLGGEVLGAHRIVHRPAVNEELALATAWGSQMGKAVDYAQVDGVAGAWYGKTPGLDRSGDVLRHANAMGAGPNGGLVLFCGDDPTAKSSTFAYDSQFTFADACVPILYPGDPQEVVDLGLHAFSLSRFAGPLVGMKIVTAVADGAGTVDLSLQRQASKIAPQVTIDGEVWRHRPLGAVGPHQVADQERLVVYSRLAAAQAYVRANGLDRVLGAEPGAHWGIVCAGKTYHDVMQSLSDLGVEADDLAALGVRILKLAMTYPIVSETAIEFAKSVEQIVVIEEKRPFVEMQLRSIVHEAGVSVRVLGKRDSEGRPLVADVGELSAQNVAEILGRLMPELSLRTQVLMGRSVIAAQLPPRAPAFCSGCPHNRSTVAPEGTLVGGGVGCHGILYFEPRQRALQKLPAPPMGAEGVPWIGLAPFVDKPHLLQNLGDGTLSHSGILAIRACVAARVNITFKILYNAAVAMTGGQEVAGLLDVPALTRELEAEGVSRIVVCAADPKHYGSEARWGAGVEVRDRGELSRTQQELQSVQGVTIIVYDQRCAAEARRLRKRGLLETPAARVVINAAVCENCGDCVAKSNCTSVESHETEFGAKKHIDDLTCNRDYTCVEGDCPSFVTLIPKQGSDQKGPPPQQPSVPLPQSALPVPAPAPLTGRFGIYFTGIGGTGVVTANRILAEAAEMMGWVTLGMDQTGLSQKGGAVTSHLTIAADPTRLGAAAVGAAGADLYLSGDLLQAAGPAHLDRIRPGRSAAVIENDLTPTAAMLQTGAAPPEVAALRAAVIERLEGGKAIFVNAKRIARTVFKDAVLANVVLLGTAFQIGATPFTLAAMEAALRRRGRAAARNRLAFEWGRWAAHDPETVDRALNDVEAGQEGKRQTPFDPSPGAMAKAVELVHAKGLPDALTELLVRRTAQVIDYQDSRKAGQFLDLVCQASERDSQTREWALTRGVAASWFRLLTYKDEYEVARLHAATDYRAMARELGLQRFTIKHHIQPQFLRKFGLKRKLALGLPLRLSFALLWRLKGLRETPFDVFGWATERRLERAVIAEYRQLVHSALYVLPYESAVEVAASASMIRGYGPVKERNIAAWRSRVRQLFPAASRISTID